MKTPGLSVLAIPPFTEDIADISLIEWILGLTAEGKQVFFLASDLPSGGSGPSTDNPYVSVSAPYLRDPAIQFIDVDASAGALAIDLGAPNNIPVEVRIITEDGTFNDVTFTYGVNTLILNIAGQTAKFVPDDSNWILWTRSF